MRSRRVASRVVSVRIPADEYHLLEAIRIRRDRDTISDVLRELVSECTEPQRPAALAEERESS